MTQLEERAGWDRAAMIAHAVRLADQGFGIVRVCHPLDEGAPWPCSEGAGHRNAETGEPCASPGKRPIGKGWESTAQHDPVRVATMLGNPGNRGYGILPPPGCFSWDIDGAAPARILELTELHGPLPHTRVHASGNGHHYFFRWPRGVEGGGSLFGIVTRWPGKGMTIGPGSVHAETGRLYAVARDAPIAELPESWARAAADWSREHVARQAAATPGDPDWTVGECSRHPFLVSQAGRLRNTGLRGEPLAAALCAINADRCLPPKPQAEVRDIARYFEANDDDRGGMGPTLLTGANGKARARTLIRMSEVVREQVSWLWPGRIALGKITVLDGDPGLGKSTVTADLAARVTRGWAMPDGTHGVGPAGVVILSAEDGLGDTIRPRLEAAGADLERVHALTTILDPLERMPAIPLDLDQVQGAIVETGALLVVIDPLMAYLGADVNSHRDQDIRRALAPLAAMAERNGAAMLLVRHLNKAAGGSPVYRGGGSIGIGGAARAVLLVGPDPDAADDDPDPRRILSVVKSNLAVMPTSLAYRLVGEPSLGCARIGWEGATAHRAADLVTTPARDADKGARDDARDFLRDLLERGPVAAEVVKTQAKAAGISERTLERAKSDLRIRSFRPDGFTGPWSWTMPGVYIATDPRTSPTPDGGGVRPDMAAYTDEEPPWPGDHPSPPVIACQGCGMPRHPLRTCADGWRAA